MTKESKEEVGTLAETCEPAIHLDMYVVGSRRGGVPEMLFDKRQPRKAYKIFLSARSEAHIRFP